MAPNELKFPLIWPHYRPSLYSVTDHWLIALFQHIIEGTESPSPETTDILKEYR